MKESVAKSEVLLDENAVLTRKLRELQRKREALEKEIGADTKTDAEEDML